MSQIESTLPKVTIGVGSDMTERNLRFSQPRIPELMKPIMTKFLAGELSIKEISEVQGVPETTDVMMTISVRDPADWTAPAVYRGNELENGVYRTKQDVIQEAARFALTTISTASEFTDQTSLSFTD